jgi:TonB-dependent SusC/RagA subfamily outer membrane receptor
MKPKSLLFVTLFFLGSILISASFVQDDPFAALLKKAEEYVKNNPQEKIHLHLDKPYYAIGDDIWFKAYILDTRASAPSTLSGALYVELIDERDSVKKQIKLPVAYGLSWGDFKLPDSLSEGNYRIRAYTQLMRNMGPEFFFDKTIKIGNSWANKVFTNTNYTYTKQNNVQNVNATIQFADKDKTPYTSAEVTYNVQLGYKSIAKGKATTNNSGEIMIGFTNPQPSQNNSGKIIATLTLPNKQKIVKNIPLKATSNEVDIQFFPEGGNLVENLPSKIGIKALSASGLGKNIEGTILDEQGTEITAFKTTHLGMGNVVISPQPGKKYTAKVKFEDGSEKSFNLPAAAQSGYVLSVNNNNPDNVQIKIMTSTNLLNKGVVKLIAQNNGNVYMVSKANTAKQVVTASIPKKSLPSGIIQLTLFSPENLPVCERLVFVNNDNNKINATLTSDKTTYAKREEVKLALSAVADAKPIEGSFSVSVTSVASVKPDLENESNILTSMLLTSDLAGYIEKPNTYFMDEEPATGQALDNLLLTQGWRRILWKNIINNIAPIMQFQPERTLDISGTVTRGKKPVPNARVSLFSSSGGFFMIDTVADENGKFMFDKLSFNDSTKFVVQARYGKDKKYVDIEIDRVPGQLVTRNKNTGDVEVNVNESIQGYLSKSNNFFEEQMRKGLLERTIQLDEVNITAEKINPAKNSSNLNGAGNADFVLSGKNLETCPTLSMCLMGRVGGLIIQNGIPYLTRSMNSSLSGRVPMTIMLDGMQVEADFLDNIQPMDVESIEVLKSASYTSMYGSNGGGGVLIITTKRGGGNLNYNTYAPGIVTYSPKGYYAGRQFYSPKYDPQNTSSNPDLRSTVYWNPHVTTDAEGKGTFNFYNTDEPGEYRVVLEGIDGNGNLARTVYTYKVN